MPDLRIFAEVLQSSPRVRVRAADDEEGECDITIIPTCEGESTARSWGTWWTSNHPHV